MEYNKFLFTRDKKKDYGWRIKADYVPAALYEKCMPIIDLIKNFPQFDEDQWEKLFFVFNIEGIGYVARIIQTNDLDGFGRPIFSFEGVSHESLSKRLELDIPNVIRYFCLHQNTFRNNYYMDGAAEKSIIVQSYINPLDDIQNIEIDIEMLDNLVFKKMICDIGTLKSDYCLVYGPGSTKIVEMLRAGFEGIKAYDPDNCLQDYKVPLTSIKNARFKECDYIGNKGRIKIEFEETKKGYGYVWFIEDVKTNLPVFRSDVFEFQKEVSIDKLCGEAKKIKNYYSLLGWEFEEE